MTPIFKFEDAVPRRTDNTMTNGKKKTKQQIMVNKTLHIKQKIEQHEPTKTRG